MQIVKLIQLYFFGPHNNLSNSPFSRVSKSSFGSWVLRVEALGSFSNICVLHVETLRSLFWNPCLTVHIKRKLDTKANIVNQTIQGSVL